MRWPSMRRAERAWEWRRARASCRISRGGGRPKWRGARTRRLNAVVANREAIAALRAGTELVKAFEISRPPAAVFEEALLAAKRELTTARASMTTGYDKSEALLRIAGSIANMADDICKEMERKLSPQEKKDRLAEE